LPVLLDCGTNNHELLDDPLYLGLRQPRPSADDLDAFVEEFVQAVREVFPACCIHFEDWKGTDALRLLARYRDKVSCYNDDVQGTGSVALAGLMNALRITGGKVKDQRILFLGAGSAAIGIADLITSAMQLEGLAPGEARNRVWMFDVVGLVESSRKDLDPDQQRYAHRLPPSHDFVATLRSMRPTAIIGVSTKGKAFDRDAIQEMTRLNERPIIFALSKPTDHAECTAQEAYEWSDGKAIFAAGVQFPPATYKGRTFFPSQANNFYVFPAVSLAVYATRAKRITDELFIEAARAISEQMNDDQRATGMLFPPPSHVLESELYTAMRVAALAFDRHLAQVERPRDIDAWIRFLLYRPEYRKS
jgi:malate dehydrogenase (oxaloacetate-decarboxylating)(NADP+)